MGNGLPDYIVRRSRRSRTMRLIVTKKREVVVTVPLRGVTGRLVREFVSAHREWIKRQLMRMEKYKDLIPLPNSKKDYLEKKTEISRLLRERVEFFTKLYGFNYARISVRNQSSIWGSCSRRGNLQFNYKIYYLPVILRDYIVVHEVCHLREPNHSERFWSLVARSVPEHKEMRKRLRKYMLREG